ncbi:MAG: hypothetical protein ABR611_08410 [Chthoniobacterales bacterium]
MNATRLRLNLKSTGAALAVLFIASALAQTQHGFELFSSTWEKGVSEVHIKARDFAQTAQTPVETEIVIRYTGIVQEIRDVRGKPLKFLSNRNGTIFGVNLRPATEVNQIYLVVKAREGQVQISQNLGLVLIPKLDGIRPGLSQSDVDDMFLTDVAENRITVEYRGGKQLTPRVRPFAFRADISENGLMTIDRDSIREL